MSPFSSSLISGLISQPTAKFLALSEVRSEYYVRICRRGSRCKMSPASFWESIINLALHYTLSGTCIFPKIHGEADWDRFRWSLTGVNLAVFFWERLPTRVTTMINYCPSNIRAESWLTWTCFFPISPLLQVERQDYCALTPFRVFRLSSSSNVLHAVPLNKSRSTRLLVISADCL